VLNSLNIKVIWFIIKSVDMVSENRIVDEIGSEQGRRSGCWTSRFKPVGGNAER